MATRKIVYLRKTYTLKALYSTQYIYSSHSTVIHTNVLKESTQYPFRHSFSIASVRCKDSHDFHEYMNATALFTHCDYTTLYIFTSCLFLVLCLSQKNCVQYADLAGFGVYFTNI